METGRAKALREAWKSKGDLPCPHARVDAESTESGYFTGKYVCKSCGAYVEVDNYSSTSERPQKQPLHWGRYALYTSMGLLAAAVPVFTLWRKRRRREPE